MNKIKLQISKEYGLDVEKIDYYKKSDTDEEIFKNQAEFFCNDKGKKRYFNICGDEIKSLKDLSLPQKDWTIFHAITMWASEELPNLLVKYMEYPNESKKEIVDFLRKQADELDRV